MYDQILLKMVINISLKIACMVCICGERCGDLCQLAFSTGQEQGTKMGRTIYGSHLDLLHSMTQGFEFKIGDDLMMHHRWIRE